MQTSDQVYSDNGGIAGDLASHTNDSTPANKVQDIFRPQRSNRQEEAPQHVKLGNAQHGSDTQAAGGLAAATGSSSPKYGDGSTPFIHRDSDRRRPVCTDALGVYGVSAAGRRIFPRMLLSPFTGLGSPNKWAGVFTFIRWAFAVWRDQRNGRIC